jgi:predicted nuclease of restriction endonuclease-like (RecB) superfamily
MARKKLVVMPVPEDLYREIHSVLEAARSSAYRAVNTVMVLAYWQVGRLIVEHEQGGKRRATYGAAVLEDLSRRLTMEFGRGFDGRNLRYMRQFYMAFPIHHALRDESAPQEKVNALRSKSGGASKRNALRSKLPDFPIQDAASLDSDQVNATQSLRPELSWTHYRLLLGIEDQVAREWYMREAVDQHWSTRQLERQISVLYYERLLASRRKAPVRKEAVTKLSKVEPEQFIRDPYVLEFLDLKDYPALRESAVEQAIIDNLQAFLLELGKGFSFVARQKRLRFEEEAFYVDLVFYNYLLKCFVLVDLKVGKLTHQDIGQMESYVRMFDAHARPEGDIPTIGLILCSRKNEAIAKYSVLSEARQIFAAKYVKVLPTERELTCEMERERRLIDARHADNEKR